MQKFRKTLMDVLLHEKKKQNVQYPGEFDAPVSLIRYWLGDGSCTPNPDEQEQLFLTMFLPRFFSKFSLRQRLLLWYKEYREKKYLEKHPDDIVSRLMFACAQTALYRPARAINEFNKLIAYLSSDLVAQATVTLLAGLHMSRLHDLFDDFNQHLSSRELNNLEDVLRASPEQGLPLLTKAYFLWYAKMTSLYSHVIVVESGKCFRRSESNIQDGEPLLDFWAINRGSGMLMYGLDYIFEHIVIEQSDDVALPRKFLAAEFMRSVITDKRAVVRPLICVDGEDMPSARFTKKYYAYYQRDFGVPLDEILLTCSPERDITLLTASLMQYRQVMGQLDFEKAVEYGLNLMVWHYPRVVDDVVRVCDWWSDKEELQDRLKPVAAELDCLPLVVDTGDSHAGNFLVRYADNATCGYLRECLDNKQWERVVKCNNSIILDPGRMCLAPVEKGAAALAASHEVRPEYAFTLFWYDVQFRGVSLKPSLRKLYMTLVCECLSMATSSITFRRNNPEKNNHPYAQPHKYFQKAGFALTMLIDDFARCDEKDNFRYLRDDMHHLGEQVLRNS
jgi:hypothetical protein